MENEKEKLFEKVAEFRKGNCTFIVNQPIKDSTPEELEKFYIALGKLI